MLNQNTNKSPKKLWKTPSPSKPSLSRPNLQFADLEANTLEELSIKELSFVSGGGKTINLNTTFKLTVDQLNLNLAPDGSIKPSIKINLAPLPHGEPLTHASFLCASTPTTFTSITF
ncbi:MAG: hypothetical protein F6K22_14810 [Okeania sp. SIO2F4]|uniref:hypothetical protein n=1 Tax=Okeania sp. SIO2F4 TaxID=2607790 RepID=UPI00142B5C82|nr:hypothetical protein [Okeania sp. SIO2F4]NES03994.1 hypothetical protein [Okeania sp. SIO2F4]